MTIHQPFPHHMRNRGAGAPPLELNEGSRRPFPHQIGKPNRLMNQALHFRNKCVARLAAALALLVFQAAHAAGQNPAEVLPAPQPQAIAPPAAEFGVQYEQGNPAGAQPYDYTPYPANSSPQELPAVSRLFRNYPLDFDPDQSSLWPRPALHGTELSLHLSELSETWLAADRNSLGLATTHIEFEMAIAGPDMRLAFSPSFQMHLLSGPSRPDLPARLYDIDLEVSFTFRLNERWTWEVTATPLVQSDFQSNNARLRVFGSVVGRYEMTPVSALVFGVAAVPYRGQSLIVVLGVQWTPSDRWQVDVVFPEPKVAWRLPDTVLPRTWLYARSQIFGGTWDVQRDSGRDDILEYEDQRIMAGLEGMFADGGRWFIEAGVAFDRQLFYQSRRGGRFLSEAAMLQGGLRF